MARQAVNRTGKAKRPHMALVGAKTLLQLLLLAIIIFVFILAALSVLNRTSAVNAEITAVQQQIDSEISRQQAIEQSINYQHSISFIEDIARRRLNLVYPDEIIFIMND